MKTARCEYSYFHDIRYHSAVPNIVCDVYWHAEKFVQQTNPHLPRGGVNYERAVEVVKNQLLAEMISFNRSKR